MPYSIRKNLMTKKIQITGSRDFDDGLVILNAIEAERETDEQRLIVVHGGARGADSIAGTIGTAMVNTLVAVMPADWKNDGRHEAGPIRNSAMLELSQPDVVLAFYKNGAKNAGTQDTVNKAEAMGIPVKKFRA